MSPDTAAIAQALGSLLSVIVAAFSAFYAAESARAAAGATRLASDNQRQLMTASVTAARQIYYRSLVTDTALAVLGPFARDAIRAVEESVKLHLQSRQQLEITGLLEAASPHPVQIFEEHYYNLRDTLVARINAWEVAAFSTYAEEILDHLQEAVTERLSRELDSRAADDVRPVIEGDTAALIRLIWQYDPAAGGQTLQAEPAVPRRILGKFV